MRSACTATCTLLSEALNVFPAHPAAPAEAAGVRCDRHVTGLGRKEALAVQMLEQVGCDPLLEFDAAVRREGCTKLFHAVRE